MKSTEIEIPVWWNNGGMLVRRDCLPIIHPEHTYNYIKDNLGLIPEDYGVFHPINEKYQHMNKEQLLSVIADLHNQIENLESMI
jgi:hypothetical protein